MPDNTSLGPTSQRLSDTQRAWEEWDKHHGRMKEKPPSKGRNYVKHALTLLSFLEPVSDAHPALKIVVVTFKFIVTVENEREENDARVSSVLLAQTDMLRVLLDLDNLKQHSQKAHADAYGRVSVLSDRIQRDIMACGNDTETYYKESKLIKFFKSNDWKERLRGHIATFDEHRKNLQLALSININAGMNELQCKMDVLLEFVFTPNTAWEKNMDSVVRQLGGQKMVLKDTTKLEQLARDTEEEYAKGGYGYRDEYPSYSGSYRRQPNSYHRHSNSYHRQSSSDRRRLSFATTNVGLSMPEPEPHPPDGCDFPDVASKMQLEDLHKSLDDLCKQNQDIFESKLNLYLQQLQETITNSVRHVVRALDGPHDRLHNEDLRALWREMKWIFCVKNKLFASALCEYYLDSFSARVNDDAEGFEETATEDLSQPTNILLSSRRMNYVLSSDDLTCHENEWILQCISLHGDKIADAIDRDRSGFIRISEANEFTDQMPAGYTLPQWCAYTAVGWSYELHIYQKRIEYITDRMVETPVKALPSNRFYLVCAICECFRILPLARGHRSDLLSDFPDNMRALVREKVRKQDQVLRRKLATLKYNIDTRGTIRLLYGNKPLETYILQLMTLLFEGFLELMQMAETTTPDIKELLITVRISCSNIVDTVSRRLKALTERTGQDDFDAEEYYGGLFSYWFQDSEEFDTLLGQPWNDQEVLARLSDDFGILDEFPPRPLPDAVVQRHTTLDVNIKVPHPEEPVPKPMVPLLKQFEDMYGSSWWLLRGSCPFPHHLSISCDNCSLGPISGLAYFRCLDSECEDVDLCANCYKSPHAESHRKSHPFAKFVLYYPWPYQEWMRALAMYHYELFECNARLLSAKDESSHHGYTCGRCATKITTGQFFQCLHSQCSGYFLCSACESAVDGEGLAAGDAVAVKAPAASGDKADNEVNGVIVSIEPTKDSSATVARPVAETTVDAVKSGLVADDIMVAGDNIEGVVGTTAMEPSKASSAAVAEIGAETTANSVLPDAEVVEEHAAIKDETNSAVGIVEAGKESSIPVIQITTDTVERDTVVDDVAMDSTTQPPGIRADLPSSSAAKKHHEFWHPLLVLKMPGAGDPPDAPIYVAQSPTGALEGRVTHIESDVSFIRSSIMELKDIMASMTEKANRDEARTPAT